MNKEQRLKEMADNIREGRPHIVISQGNKGNAITSVQGNGNTILAFLFVLATKPDMLPLMELAVKMSRDTNLSKVVHNTNTPIDSEEFRKIADEFVKNYKR